MSFGVVWLMVETYAIGTSQCDQSLLRGVEEARCRPARVCPPEPPSTLATTAGEVHCGRRRRTRPSGGSPRFSWRELKKVGSATNSLRSAEARRHRNARTTAGTRTAEDAANRLYMRAVRSARQVARGGRGGGRSKRTPRRLASVAAGGLRRRSPRGCRDGPDGNTDGRPSRRRHGRWRPPRVSPQARPPARDGLPAEAAAGAVAGCVAAAAASRWRQRWRWRFRRQAAAPCSRGATGGGRDDDGGGSRQCRTSRSPWRPHSTTPSPALRRCSPRPPQSTWRRARCSS